MESTFSGPWFLRVEIRWWVYFVPMAVPADVPRGECRQNEMPCSLLEEVSRVQWPRSQPSPSICFISCCAGSPTSKLSSVCQASHGTGSPVSKTHGSSFVTSAVKVMFSLGVYFPFKVQLPIKWGFLVLKILLFRQVS